MREAVVNLVAASVGLIAYSRAHEIDLGMAGGHFEAMLEALAPGTMGRVNKMCPPATSLVVAIASQSRAGRKRKLFVQMRRKAIKHPKINPIKGKPVRSRKPNGVVEIRPPGI